MAKSTPKPRGVSLPDRHRSRWEVPWESVTSLAQCRARLEDSRRMRLATLAVWPADPHLENTYRLGENGPFPNAIERFVRGLSHDDNHLGQIREIVRQAQAARQAAGLTAPPEPENPTARR